GGGEEGGIEAWLRLGEAMGVGREEMVSHRRLLPGVRFAVDAYVEFCRSRPWLGAGGASLPELFAPLIGKGRLAAILRLYRGRSRGVRLPVEPTWSSVVPDRGSRPWRRR